jgi:hypothetical protein
VNDPLQWRKGLRADLLFLAAMLLAVPASQGSFAAEALHAATKVGKPIAPRNLLGRRSLSRPASERVAPNAIGALVPQSKGVQGGESGSRGARPDVQAPATAARPRIEAGFAKSGGPINSPTRLQLHTIPTVNPAASNRPVINGTSLSPRGSSPSGIGGPAKAVAGISGTAIRPRH